MMKLGFASAILAELRFEEVVSFAAEQRFHCVELMCWPVGKAERRYAGVTHIDVATLTDEKAGYIREYMHEKQVEISALGYYPNPLDEDLERREFYVEHLKKVMVAARRLGVGLVTTFIGRAQSRSIAGNFAEFERVWRPLVAFAEENGVKIGIENCPMFFTRDEWPAGKNMAYSPAIWERMFELIPSPHFGLNYDPSHMIWQQMDYIKPIYEFKERLFHIHLKDVKLYPDQLDRVGILATPLEYHAPKLPGLGDVNWGRFFSALTDVRYRGPVCIEVEDRAFEDSLDDKKYSICLSRDYVAQWVQLK